MLLVGMVTMHPQSVHEEWIEVEPSLHSKSKLFQGELTDFKRNIHFKRNQQSSSSIALPRSRTQEIKETEEGNLIDMLWYLS